MSRLTLICTAVCRTVVMHQAEIGSGLHRKNRFVMLTMKVCYLRCIILVHIKVTNFLVEMTNFHVTLTEECGDAPLITYLFLLCMIAKQSIVLQPHSTSKPPPITACCMTTVLQTAIHNRTLLFPQVLGIIPAAGNAHRNWILYVSGLWV